MRSRATKEHRDKWKRENPDKVAASHKRWAERPEVRARRLAQVIERNKKNLIRVLRAGARSRAKERGMEYSLPSDWKDGATHCELSGLAFIYADPMYSASIDRIDNNIGYTESNCRVILRGLNQFKSNHTEEDMMTVARAMVAHNSGEST